MIHSPIGSPVGSPVGSPLVPPIASTPWLLDANFRLDTLKAAGTTGGPYAQLTRNCTAWAQVYGDGSNLRWAELPAHEAIRHGWRYWRNMLRVVFATPLNSSDDLSGASTSNATVAYISGESTLTVTGASGDSYVRLTKSTATATGWFRTGDKVTISCKIKALGSAIGKLAYLQSGAAGDTPAIAPFVLTGSFQRFTFQRPAKLNDGTEYIYLALRVGTDATLSEGDQVVVKNVQIERIRGGFDATPSEYVFVDASNDGIGWSRYTNGNSVDAGVVTEGVGTLIPEASRRDLVIEPEATNSLPYSRDLSNASWTKTNVTLTKDQTGFDGVQNVAYRLTASAANSTCLYAAISAASGNHAFKAQIKRVTGTGTVEMTVDGGTTWQDVTSDIGASGYAVVTIDQAAVTNPVVGFRIITSGDEIAVDVCVVHLNKTIAQVKHLGPIVTNGSAVTRYADEWVIPEAGNFNHAAGSLMFEGQIMTDLSTFSGGLVTLTNTSTGLLYSNGGQDNLYVYDGIGVAPISGVLESVDFNVAVRWGEGKQLVLDGAIGTLSSYDGDFNTSNNGIKLGKNINTPISVRRLRIARRDLGTAKLQELTS